MRGWRHINSAMEETVGSPSFSDSTCTPWLGDAGNYLESRCNGRAFEKKEAVASRRKKNAASDCVYRGPAQDRKSTRLNSSHSQISYAVFCLKKKKTSQHNLGYYQGDGRPRRGYVA